MPQVLRSVMEWMTQLVSGECNGHQPPAGKARLYCLIAVRRCPVGKILYVSFFRLSNERLFLLYILFGRILCCPTRGLSGNLSGKGRSSSVFLNLPGSQ